MSNLRFATPLRNNQLDEITAYAGTSAKLTIYSGTQPAGGGAITTALAELVCSVTSFAGSAAAGSLLLNAITADVSANATGVGTWWRITTSGDVFVMDGDITTVGGNGDMQLDNTSIVLDANVAMSGPNSFQAPNAP